MDRNFLFSRRLRLDLLAWTVILGLILPASGAHALESDRYSEQEKVGMALFKLGKVEPDYPAWVKSSDVYINRPVTERDQLLQAEILRLEQGMNSYSPDQDMIKVMVDVMLLRQKETDIKKNQKDRYVKIELPLGGAVSGIYLPFSVAGIPIAVIPQDMEAFEALTLSQAEYEKLKSVIFFGGPYNNNAAADLELKLRPVAVDVQKPVNLDGTAYWPLLVEIGSASIKDKRTGMIGWAWDAPWFTSENHKELIDLYEK